MGNSLTIRDMDPVDKAWVKREADRLGISMSEFIRREIHDERIRSENRPKPSEVFERHFGEENGVDLRDLIENPRTSTSTVEG